MVDTLFYYLAAVITIVTGILLLIAPFFVFGGIFYCIYLSFCPNKANKTRDKTSA